VINTKSVIWIADRLRDHLPGLKIVHRGDMSYSAEFGGELPSSLVDELTEAGAEVVVYHLHRADASTVVMF
jgi:predicted nicotinamide N-methyase